MIYIMQPLKEINYTPTYYKIPVRVLEVLDEE